MGVEYGLELVIELNMMLGSRLNMVVLSRILAGDVRADEGRIIHRC